jgi:hypothetical protein
MEMFDYVAVITSIIIGLAIAHLLQGLAQIIQHPGRRPVYWVHLVWVASLFLSAVFWWWSEYRLREIETWTFELYFFVLTYAFVIYLSCALLFPKEFHEYDGFRDYFYSRRRWFFGLLALWQVIDLADTWLKGAEHFASLGLEYPIGSGVLLVLSLIAVRTCNERFHASYAVLALGYNVSWVLRMFDTVN